ACACRPLPLMPEGERAGHRIAQDAVVEPGPDGVEERLVEHLVAQEGGVGADGWAAPVARRAAVEARAPPLRARAVAARDRPERATAGRTAGEVGEQVGRGVAGRLDGAAGQ